MAEFCKVYAVCLQTNKLEELKEQSPNRFRIWDHCMKLVNSTLRNKKCADSEDVPLEPELPVQDEISSSSAEETLVTPPDDYEPDSNEVTSDSSSDFLFLIVMFILAVLVLLLVFRSIRKMKKSKSSGV